MNINMQPQTQAQVQVQPSFNGRVGKIDYDGLKRIGMMDSVVDIVSELKKFGNDQTLFSFYATKNGNVGVYCEEQYKPCRDFLDVLSKKMIAKGDGFVFKEQFVRFKEATLEAIRTSLEKCQQSKEGRNIHAERAITFENKLAKTGENNNPYFYKV